MKRSYIIALVIIVIIVVAGIALWMSNSGSYAPSASNPSSTTPTASTPPATTPTTTTGGATTPSPNFVLDLATSPTLGVHLVATNGKTLYTYSGDKSGVSNCTGACATSWPPYTVPASEALISGSGTHGTVSTIKRGTALQVTYNGMPLYFWSNDVKPGDTTGNGVGGFAIVKP